MNNDSRQPKFNKDGGPIILHPDHPKPITRRQFLASGLISSLGYVMAPSIAALLTQDALAAGECPTFGADPGLLPFILIDCAGGAALSGNWVVRDVGEKLLTSYNTLGVPAGLSPSAVNSIDSQFGASFWNGAGSNIAGVPANGQSQIRAGIMAATTATTRANTSMGLICNTSQDDSGNNPLSPLQLITKAGYRGSILPNGVGTNRTPGGVNSTSPINDPSVTPVVIATPTAISDLLAFGGAIRALPALQKQSMMKAITAMNTSQAASFRQQNQGQQFASLSQCAFDSNVAYAAGISGADARLDSNVQTVYGITAASQGTAAQRAAIVYSVLMNNTGPGGISIGGCDYHRQDRRNVGDAKDREIGTEIGRILELAARLKKAVVIGVITDGGLASQSGADANGIMQWSSDSGSRSLTAMICYKPGGKPAMSRTQIGGYGAGQAVSSAGFFGANSPAQVSNVMLANYLKLCGKDPQPIMQGIITNNFPFAQLSNVLLFS